jgi:hypothetical protein
MSMGLREQFQSTLRAELQVARTTECNAATTPSGQTDRPESKPFNNLTARRLSGDLAAAIQQACRARGDSEDHCQALIADCAEMSQAQQLDLLEHFCGEVQRSGGREALPHHPPGARN